MRNIGVMIGTMVLADRCARPIAIVHRMTVMAGGIRPRNKPARSGSLKFPHATLQLLMPCQIPEKHLQRYRSLDEA